VRFCKRSHISIPYGAIKSFAIFIFYYTRSYISIPYGAIKRMQGRRFSISQILFQFLMVRLKDLSASVSDKSNPISIPYGAIKSNFFTNLSKIAKKFQFLMVRLKGR